MKCKGTFDIREMNPITMEFMLYNLSRGLLPCNQTFVNLEISLILP